MFLDYFAGAIEVPGREVDRLCEACGEAGVFGVVGVIERGGNTLYCRLGGDPSFASGQSVIIPGEDNRNAISMWQGDSAPQRPTSSARKCGKRSRAAQPSSSMSRRFRRPPRVRPTSRRKC